MYVESDSDATSCYLFFRRMAYKANLINTVVAQIHNLPDALNGDVSDVLVGVCEVRITVSPSSLIVDIRCADARPNLGPGDAV